MRELFFLTVLVCLLVLASCTSAPSDSRQQKTTSTTTSATTEAQEKDPDIQPTTTTTEPISSGYPVFVKSAKEDLNSDGKIDTIALSGITQWEGDFTLTINGASVKGRLNEGEPDGFIVIDIDKSDKYKEVAVHTSGPSDDDEYALFYYDGKLIKEMGRLSRWPKFAGNGIIYVDSWRSFWSPTNKYILAGDRKLKLIPQEFYFVGAEATVTTGFPVFEKRSLANVVASLKQGSKIQLLVCNLASGETADDWYLIKSETNILGWARFGDIFENVTGLPMAD